MSGRIVVLISGSGSNMVALVDSCRGGDLDAEVVGVVADRDCEGLKKASERSVPVDLIEPKKYSSREEWNGALRDAVAKYSPDLVVSAGFMRILAPVFVDAFSGRLINLHPSLLPAFPGAHAVRDALAFGVKVTGTTIHYMDHEVDHGEIIEQIAVPIRPNDTEESLHERIKVAERGLLPFVCAKLLDPATSVEHGPRQP